MPKQMVRTTPALPADLLTAVDDAVREGRARNRGELISAAVRHELAMHERSAIDQAFAAMSGDEAYLRGPRGFPRSPNSSDGRRFALVRANRHDASR